MPDSRIETVAFLSYAHLDDAGAIGELSAFHDQLQSELRIQTGLPVQIFFDRKSIGWGKRWLEFIDDSLQNAAFFIPILTPAFFQSQACRHEYMEFKNNEEKLGRHDLILPIYYVRCREMDFASGIDPLVDDVLTRQYRDWKLLRHQSRDSVKVMQEFASLGAAMAETLFDLQAASELPAAEKKQKLLTDTAANKQLDSVLERPISFENLVLYSVSEFPSLRVSQSVSRLLLEHINPQRYVKIRDLDREVKYARPKIEAYAKERPDKFKSSTDYIVKSLLFVDSQFRNTHATSMETKAAAETAGITRY